MVINPPPPKKKQQQTNKQNNSIRFCCCYETMSNCSQNCWIDWNSAMLCFKQLFHIGVWTFGRFVRPLLATILCMGNSVPAYTMYMYHAFPCWLKKEDDIMKLWNYFTNLTQTIDTFIPFKCFYCLMHELWWAKCDWGVVNALARQGFCHYLR